LDLLVGVEVVLQVLEGQSVVEDLTGGQNKYKIMTGQDLHVGDLGGGRGGDGGGSGEDGSGGGELHLVGLGCLVKRVWVSWKVWFVVYELL
jgi:hypothetical protein